jgi:hypothetical protein
MKIIYSLYVILKRAFGVIATLPFKFKEVDVSPPKNVSHDKWIEYLSNNFNKAGLRILEVGSRNVTGYNHRSMFNKWQYRFRSV